MIGATTDVLMTMFIAILGCALSAPVHDMNILDYPPFLEGAPISTIAEFHELIQRNHHLNDEGMNKKVVLWIAAQNTEIQKKYVLYQKAVARAIASHEMARKEAVKNFSPAAMAADAEMEKIANDPTLSIKEKSEKMEAFHRAMPLEVRAEIDSAMRRSRH